MSTLSKVDCAYCETQYEHANHKQRRIWEAIAQVKKAMSERDEYHRAVRVMVIRKRGSGRTSDYRCYAVYEHTNELYVNQGFAAKWKHWLSDMADAEPIVDPSRQGYVIFYEAV